MDGNDECYKYLIKLNHMELSLVQFGSVRFGSVHSWIRALTLTGLVHDFLAFLLYSKSLRGPNTMEILKTL